MKSGWPLFTFYDLKQKLTWKLQSPIHCNCVAKWPEYFSKHLLCFTEGRNFRTVWGWVNVHFWNISFETVQNCYKCSHKATSIMHCLTLVQRNTTIECKLDSCVDPSHLSSVLVRAICTPQITCTFMGKESDVSGQKWIHSLDLFLFFKVFRFIHLLLWSHKNGTQKVIFVILYGQMFVWW